MPNSTKNSELDKYLLQAINHIKSKWFNPEVGFVSCLIIDDGNVSSSTNIIKKDGMISHAEKEALEKYKKTYGDISTSGTAIITLSPCIEFSRNRIGLSCASLLLESGVKRIHFGHLHDKQGTIETYKKLGFEPTLTENTLLNSVSKNLLQFYLDNKNALKRNFSTWIEAKKLESCSLFKGV